jgi:hypothetical protein
MQSRTRPSFTRSGFGRACAGSEQSGYKTFFFYARKLEPAGSVREQRNS